MLHVLDVLEVKHDLVFDCLLLLQPTTPLRSEAHIREALQIMKRGRCDGVVSVRKVSNTGSVMYLDHGFLRKGNPERHSAESKNWIWPTGGFYLLNIEALRQTGSIFCEQINLRVVTIDEPKFLLDIDDQLDWDRAIFYASQDCIS